MLSTITKSASTLAVKFHEILTSKVTTTVHVELIDFQDKDFMDTY